MKFNQYAAIVERRREVHASLLPTFDEIVQSCVKIAQAARGIGNAFSSLQSYLDEGVIAGGVSCQRRSVLLAVHDMIEDREAPLALQRKALAQLILLQMHPVPKLTLYRDIATAILRMEAVMRLSAAQAPQEQQREPVLTPASLHHLEDLRQWVHSSAEAVSAGLASFRAVLPVIHAPGLSLLALSVRYQRPSGLRAVIST